jgi:3-phenylpropionate/cinnamic acid dioxygenase small subunit
VSKFETDVQAQHAAEQFLYLEARLLDWGKWREWQQLFSADAIYWLPASLVPYDPNLHVSIVYDDMALLEERIIRLESGLAYSQEPASRTVHQISNVSVEVRGDAWVVHSSLVLCEFKPNSQRRLEGINVYPALCEHELVGEPGEWKIRRKKVVLLQSDGTIGDLTFLV